MQKSEVYMIQTQATDMAGVAELFPGKIGVFPTNYLGLPIHIGRTRQVDEQVLVDKIGARLPSWKGQLLNRAGRLAFGFASSNILDGPGGKIIRWQWLYRTTNGCEDYERINSETALRQYVELWTQLSQVQLAEADDTIV
jgi:hypothetical protein